MKWSKISSGLGWITPNTSWKLSQDWFCDKLWFNAAPILRMVFLYPSDFSKSKHCAILSVYDSHDITQFQSLIDQYHIVAFSNFLGSSDRSKQLIRECSGLCRAQSLSLFCVMFFSATNYAWWTPGIFCNFHQNSRNFLLTMTVEHKLNGTAHSKFESCQVTDSFRWKECCVSS